MRIRITNTKNNFRKKHNIELRRLKSMKTHIKRITLLPLVIVLLSAPLAISQAAENPQDKHRHHQTQSQSESAAISESDSQATVEREVVRERVRVGPRSKARFVWRVVEPDKPAIEAQRAPGRNPVGPPSRTRGRNR